MMLEFRCEGKKLEREPTCALMFPLHTLQEPCARTAMAALGQRPLAEAKRERSDTGGKDGRETHFAVRRCL